MDYVHQFRDHRPEDILHLDPLPVAEFHKDLLYYLFFLLIQLLEVQNTFLGQYIADPSCQ